MGNKNQESRVYIWVCPYCDSLWYEKFDGTEFNKCPYCNKDFEVEIR